MLSVRALSTDYTDGRGASVRAVQEPEAVGERLLVRRALGDDDVGTREAQPGEGGGERRVGGVEREVEARDVQVAGGDVEELVAREAVPSDREAQLDREREEQRRDGRRLPRAHAREVLDSGERQLLHEHHHTPLAGASPRRLGRFGPFIHEAFHTWMATASG